jgi:hypothetical protein
LSVRSGVQHQRHDDDVLQPGAARELVEEEFEQPGAGGFEGRAGGHDERGGLHGLHRRRDGPVAPTQQAGAELGELDDVVRADPVTRSASSSPAARM